MSVFAQQQTAANSESMVECARVISEMKSRLARLRDELTVLDEQLTMLADDYLNQQLLLFESEEGQGAFS